MSEITPNTPNPVREDAYKQQLATKLGIDPKYIPGSPIWHSEEEIAAIAEMFANMAGGSSGGGVLVVHEDIDTGALDKTWQEIADSDLCILNYYGSKMIQYGTVEPIGQGKFKVFFWDFYESSQVVYEADTPTDYPVIVDE